MRNFHQIILVNRRGFLEQELRRLQLGAGERDEQIQRLSDRRAELLEILRSHGALDELNAMQREVLVKEAALKDVEGRIKTLRNFEQGKSKVRIEREILLQRARRDYEERQSQRDRAIDLFNRNSEALYSAPGNLVVDVGPTGYSFDVEIERSGSQGIGNMKVFCYDLTLTQLWSRRQPSPGLLIHDSTIFADVDERQTALALELAAREADSCGFQYICMLNSDAVPTDEFSQGFSLDPSVRLRLTDDTERGGLLGMRF